MFNDIYHQEDTGCWYEVGDDNRLLKGQVWRARVSLGRWEFRRVLALVHPLSRSLTHFSLDQEPDRNKLCLKASTSCRCIWAREFNKNLKLGCNALSDLNFPLLPQLTSLAKVAKPNMVPTMC